MLQSAVLRGIAALIPGRPEARRVLSAAAAARLQSSTRHSRRRLRTHYILLRQENHA